MNSLMRIETAESIRFAVAECSLGPILVAARRKGICAILLGDDAAALVGELRDRFPEAQPARRRRRTSSARRARRT